MKIAILGFGVVGSGAYEILQNGGYEVKRVLDLRKIDFLGDKVTSDINDIVGDDEITVVAEAMGGLEPAHEYAVATLKAGKHFVTSNKHLMCEYFDELNELAAENGVSVRYCASAGGGIPWLYNLARYAETDEIYKISGIMNGTTNFILDAMSRLGESFGDALKKAQELGYAERDPSADVDGFDLARKTALSASVAFGKTVSEKDVALLSMRTARKEDIDYIAENFGAVVRYLGIAEKRGDCITAFAEPVIVAKTSLEAGVTENNNLISLYGKNTGRLAFYGQGAGKYPTGENVANDVIDALSGAKSYPTPKGKAVVDNTAAKRKYFVSSSVRLDEKITFSVFEKDDRTYTVTKDTDAAAMRKIAEKILKEDETAFIAGFDTEI